MGLTSSCSDIDCLPTSGEKKDDIYDTDNKPTRKPKNSQDNNKFENVMLTMRDLRKYQAKHTINKNGSVTFYPTPNSEPDPYNDINISKLSKNTFLKDQNCKQTLCESEADTVIYQAAGCPKMCSFITGALIAWSEHYPFRFRPEHIWLLIIQGVAMHVDLNAEKLRYPPFCI